MDSTNVRGGKIPYFLRDLAEKHGSAQNASGALHAEDPANQPVNKEEAEACGSRSQVASAWS
jgi:hypothetical protein